MAGLEGAGLAEGMPCLAPARAGLRPLLRNSRAHARSDSPRKDADEGPHELLDSVMPSVSPTPSPVCN